MSPLFFQSKVIASSGSAPSIQTSYPLLQHLKRLCPHHRVFKLSYLALIAIISTVIMGLPPKHLPLQRIVAQILTHPQLKNKLCKVEWLCPILNALGGSAYDGSIAEVDSALLKKAFKDTNGTTEYFTPYKNSDTELVNLDMKSGGIIGGSILIYSSVLISVTVWERYLMRLVDLLQGLASQKFPRMVHTMRRIIH